MCDSSEMIKQELIELTKKNGPEWTDGIMALMRAAKGATHEQIEETVKTLSAVNGLNEQIEEGEQIIKRAPDRDLSAWQCSLLKEMSNNDPFEIMSSAFLIGVATGAQIAREEV